MSDTKAVDKRRHKKAVKETAEKMRALGVYKPEFDDAIERYVQICEDYERIRKRWIELGSQVVTVVEKGDGQTVERKSVIYQGVTDLRKEIRAAELELGLNPKGLKAIQAKGLETKRVSVLDQLFDD